MFVQIVITRLKCNAITYVKRILFLSRIHVVSLLGHHKDLLRIVCVVSFIAKPESLYKYL